MMTIEARSNFSLAIRRRRSLISSMYSSMPQVYSRFAASNGLLVNQRVGGDRGADQDGNDIDDFDHWVDRGPGGVLVGIAGGVACDGGRMRLRSLAAVVAVLDVLLGVVPGATTRRHLDRQEDPGHDSPNEHAAERLGPQGEAHQQRRGHRNQPGDDHFSLGRPRDEIDRPAVLGLARPFHQPLILPKLPPHSTSDSPPPPTPP